MSIKFKLVLGAVLVAGLPVSAVQADSITTGYNINQLLNQGHPLAHRMGTKWRPATQANAPAGVGTQALPGSTVNPKVYGQTVAPAPRTVSRSTPPPTAPGPVPVQSRPRQSDAMPETADSSSGWREATARASARGKPLGGILAEVSLGALMHDQGPFSNSKEDGIDAHIEIRFKSPDFLDIIWGPEPHIGANINSKGDTSQVFAGLSYEWLIWKGLFAGISVGGAYHDGETDAHLVDKKDLGCKLLFRESITLGWEITKNHKIAAVFDHISNAKICDFNEGLENLGARYSYRF